MNVDSNPEPRLRSGPNNSHSGLQCRAERITEKPIEQKVPQTNPGPWKNPENYCHLREFVRLLQCEICHKILQQPIALPCGQTLCRSCIPSVFERKNISYPGQTSRREGFTCPFRSCQTREHSLADCNLDITFAKVLSAVEGFLYDSQNGAALLGDTRFSGELEDMAPANVFQQSETPINLLSAYRLAQQGRLPFDSDFPSFSDRWQPSSATKLQESQLWRKLLSGIRSEFDCQVCYCLLHSPITTSCGHTFCGSCLNQVKDHSNLCPFCRRSLSPFQSTKDGRGSKRLQTLLLNLFPEDVATRQEQAADDMPIQTAAHTIPIFACAMTFPQVPMFLHIFEPRYRLMLRRAIDDGTRSFGMVAHRRGPVPAADGEFDAPFARYGTMLYVTNLQMFPDGRSLIETIGTYRFRIISYSWHDGYPLAKIERVEDIAYADEENMEAAERMLNTVPGGAPNLTHVSTQELHRQAIEFVNSMRNHPAGWFTDRILNTYGQPPQDPAIFPFWMATLLPVHDREKYLVLVSTSVRERLKLVMAWIQSMEQRSWFSTGSLSSSCIVS